MATGIPKKKKTNIPLRNIALSYPDKLQASDILATPPANTVSIGCGHAPAHESAGNRLYFGENLGILASLAKQPDIAGNIRLIYIDPPFSTQTAFQTRKLQHAYEDTLSGADFIEFLRRRLIFLWELLADNGSIYLHLDEKMVFHMKIIMDEIFGPQNYQNCITRKKCNPKNYTRKRYGNISDYILFYTKTSKFIWNKPLEPWTEERAKEYQYVEPETGRRFMKVPVHAPGVRRGETGKEWRGMMPPPGKHWQYTPARLDEMDARGEIYWSSNGNPRRKVYLDESPGVSVQDIWTDFKDAHNQNVKITGYPTEKNPDLLRRIIEASSDPGDIVLDCFSGSGTTLAVADMLGRRWIGIDNSAVAIKATLDRFARGTEPMGDFVSPARKKRKSKEPNNIQPSLFDEIPSRQASEKEPHQAITQFIFHAEEGREDDAETLCKNSQCSLKP